MNRTLTLAAMGFSLLSALASGAVLAASFYAPDVVFAAVGTVGLLTAVVLVTVSLWAFVRTADDLVAASTASHDAGSTPE